MPVTRNKTIRGKLILITMLTCIAALLLAGAALTAWQWGTLRHTIARNLSTQAEIIAENCKAAVVFKDAEDAKETLMALHVEPSIVFGGVYTSSGEVFAGYYRNDVDSRVRPSELKETGYSFGDGFLTVFKSIVLDGEKIGTVCLRSDLSPMYTALRRSAENIITVLLLASLAAYFMSSRLQRIISRPILSLAELAKTVSEKKDYTTRALKQSNDEVGLLMEAFNEMLEQIQQRDSALVGAKEQLEIRVKDRTSDLAAANSQLEQEITERSLAQERLQQHVKQLNCFYGLSRLVEQPEIPLEQMFQETVHLIRNAYQYPDDTCVRITFSGIQYKTDNFEKSELSQYARINIYGNEVGAIEVYYLGEKTENGQTPFLKEEYDLLNTVAEHLGRIAERKQARDGLQLFRNLIDRSNDCIFVIEAQWGRFLDVNSKACAALGYTRKELLDMTFKDIEDAIPDDSRWQEHVQELKFKGDTIIQGRHRRKDATTFPVETSLKLVSQEQENYIIAVARDITERKQMEEKLQQSYDIQTILNKLLNISLQSITLENMLEQTIDYVTDIPWLAFEESKGAIFLVEDEPQVLVLKAQRGLSTPLETMCARVPFGRCICGQAALSRKIEFVDCVDERHEHRYEGMSAHGHYCVPILSAGKVLGVINLYVKEGHRRSEKEEEFLHAVADVMAAIIERKRAEEKQYQLTKEVESVNRELKDFAYIVSHDLKAPLRGIKTLANWMSTDYADKFDEQGKEQMNLLLTRVDRMHNLIDGILQYSRVGRIKEEQVRVNLNELVLEIIDMVAPPENIAITVENELPVIECEETRIIQVFQNLLSNAIKYMDKPKGQIRIGCVEEDSFWKFSVTDNGPGIKEEYFEKIFKIFQTLLPRDEFESTGVGLTVVKKIIEMYGGKIWVESKPGEGSTFFFTLPKSETREEVTSVAVKGEEKRYEN